MQKEKLMQISYLTDKVHLKNYADTLAYYEESGSRKKVLCLARFGGYPEMVRAMSDASYGGGTLTVELPDGTVDLSSTQKQYDRTLSHDGIYAEAVLLHRNDPERIEGSGDAEEELESRRHFFFSKPNDRDALFQAIDEKTCVPLIPAFRDYLIAELQVRGILSPLIVKSVSAPLEGWQLICTKNDENIVSVVEDGLAAGIIKIPDGGKEFPEFHTVTGYLQAFSNVLGEQIKARYTPLFDPGQDTLCPELLEINEHVREKAGYSLYQAQLAVAESMKRRLDKERMGLIVAECGSGKTKIGAAALAAHQRSKGKEKCFNIVLGPSHMTGKWVREIEETVPNAFGTVVRNSIEIEELYRQYAKGAKTCFAVISKEKARDGYMRRPTVLWSHRKQGFLCPDCGERIEEKLSPDSDETIPVNQFFFLKETAHNHKCESCGSSLWTAVNPNSPQGCGEWAKIGEYGFVHVYDALPHEPCLKNERQLEQLMEIIRNPNTFHKPIGAHRSFPLSRYIKTKMKGRIDGLLVDELQDFNNKSGQGDAMAELFQAAKKTIAMTGTLINGYGSVNSFVLFPI